MQDWKINLKKEYPLLILSLLIIISLYNRSYIFTLKNKDILYWEDNFDKLYPDVNFNLSLARRYHYFDFEEFNDSALKFYINAVELNPVSFKAWLGIAELLNDTGRSEESNKVIKHVTSSVPYSFSEIWQASILASINGSSELALDNLLRIAKYDGNRQAKVFELLTKTYNDPSYITTKITDVELLVDFFNYLVSKSKLPESIYLWNYLEKNNVVVDDKYKFNYITLLINRNRVNEAFNIWNNIYNTKLSRNLVWNGDFEYELNGRGFDWQIQESKYADIVIDNSNTKSGDKTLKVFFSGKTNINFYHVKKIVPLLGYKKYLFSFAYSSKDITTDSGLYWEIKCNHKKTIAFSNMILGSKDWYTEKLEFTTPYNCNNADLILIRKPIKKLNNRISGTVWFDEIEIKEIS